MSFQSYPEWAKTLAEKYLSKTVSQFVLHGNVHDLVKQPVEKGTEFVRLKTFLSEDLFGARDIVLYYDRSGGIQFRDKSSMQDFSRAVSGYDSIAGTEFGKKMPKDPVRAFGLMENYVRLRVSEGKSIAVIIDYAETIVPMADAASTAAEDRNVLVYLQKWAHDPLLLASDYTLILLTENLNDLNKNLIQSPHNVALKIQLPDFKDRCDYLDHFNLHHPLDSITTIDPKVIAQQTAGLSYVNLNTLLSNATENNQSISFDTLRALKKELIEAEAYGLLEFVETPFDLQSVAGHTQVKKHLKNAASALKSGKSEVMPMGYLVSGPVGTGKTFLVTCFANEIGVPMVKLKNFRSQWQGVTEGNLEKILTLLKAMAPVAVMIDEADAYLGDRSSSGDSGVSSRVFAQIAQFMSNTEHRGKIIWFLMTARPDLMPVDLKRQGRAEEHLALFYPSTSEERVELFEAMKRKTGLDMDTEEVPEAIKNGELTYSGADMEAALTRAKFRAASQGAEKVTLAILEETFEDFIPPTYPEEIELQILTAVLECTSRSLLPEPYRSMSRAEVVEQIEDLKLML